MQQFATFYSKQYHLLESARQSFVSARSPVQPEYISKVTAYMAEEENAKSKSKTICYDHSIYHPTLEDSEKDRHFAWHNSIVQIDLNHQDKTQPAVPMQAIQVRLSHRPLEN